MVVFPFQQEADLFYSLALFKNIRNKLKYKAIPFSDLTKGISLIFSVDDLDLEESFVLGLFSRLSFVFRFLIELIRVAQKFILLSRKLSLKN